MTKLIFLRAINLARYQSCSIFEGRMAQRTTNMRLDRMDFLENFLPHWLHCSGKQVRVASGRWYGASGVTRIWLFVMWWFNFFLLERTLKQELQKWPKEPRGILPPCPPPPPGCHTYPPHPFSSPTSPPPHHHPSSPPPHPPPSPTTSGGLNGLQTLPPFLQGPVGQALECMHIGLASFFPQVPK